MQRSKRTARTPAGGSAFWAADRAELLLGGEAAGAALGKGDEEEDGGWILYDLAADEMRTRERRYAGWYEDDGRYEARFERDSDSCGVPARAVPMLVEPHPEPTEVTDDGVVHHSLAWLPSPAVAL